MSKNNQYKLKEVKEMNIKYNGAKDVEIISPTYSKIQKSLNNRHSVQSSRTPKQLVKQISKISIKLKEKDNEEYNKEKLNEKDTIKEVIKEKGKEKERGNLSSSRKSNKYIEKIKELEEKIKKMNLEYTNDIQRHKNEIEKNEKDIQKLLNTNTNLKNSLEVLTQRLDKVLINSTNNQKVKLKKTETNIEELQKQLEIKEKELKNQQTLINILKNDNKHIRKLLSSLQYDENNLNLVEKINQQYHQILNLQKNFDEYKLKHSESQKNINTNDLTIKPDDKKPKKFVLNSFSRQGGFLSTKNKSKSIDNNNKRYMNGAKKKFDHHNVSSTFNYDKNNSNIESIFTFEEKNVIKNYFIDDENYQNFINKINILEKSSIVKEKEMDMKIKIIDNKLKEREKELELLKKETKEKDNVIIALNIENKELKKNTNELISKINILTKTLNDLDQKNQLIMKKNEEIRNSIFNIDGIIEAKSKEGNTIPIVKEKNNKNKNNNLEETNRTKNDEKNKNSFNFTNSDEAGEDN